MARIAYGSFKNSVNILFIVVQFVVILAIPYYVIAVDGIDIDDILSTHMMPLNVFLIRLSDKLNQKYTEVISPVLQTMSYHRKMRQQFMASDYLTNQILNWSVEKNNSKLMKRFGKMQNESNIKNTNYVTTPTETFAKLLLDDGSSRYNDWLQRTTTLDDIQNQLNKAAIDFNENENPIRRQNMNPYTKTDLITYLEEDENDDGDITGYAYDGVHNESNYFNLFPHKEVQSPRSLVKAYIGDKIKQINKSGYETSYEDLGMHQPPPEHSSAIFKSTKQIKEIGLKDITDIALTTLAFLSFGMFILQVLMCITMNKEDGNNLMMLPMEATEPVDVNDGTEEIRRRKRSIPQRRAALIRINELTQNVLITIDKLFLIENRETNMKNVLQYLCTDTIHIRKNKHNPKIWTTLYSLGTSWLAARLSHDYLSMMKHLVHIIEGCF